MSLTQPPAMTWRKQIRAKQCKDLFLISCLLIYSFTHEMCYLIPQEDHVNEEEDTSSIQRNKYSAEKEKKSETKMILKSILGTFLR